MDSSKLAFKLSKEGKMSSAELGFKLSQEFGEDGFDELPIENRWATYGKFQLVGNGKVTNENCGKFKGLRGCLNVENHDIIASDGKNYKGKFYIKKVRFTCHKASCPVCYNHGFAVREAGNIESRLMVLSRHFGEVEHIVISVPSWDYGLTLKCLRRKVTKILYDCGIIGGVIIFHGFRYNVKKQWYWSIHFHVLGFVLGGYGRCRHCKGGNCYACDGSLGKFYKAYRSDGYSKGYIVDVKGKRKKSYYSDKPNIFGTAWYQLNHATIDITKKRFHVATWFGCCSYRKFKLTSFRKKSLCPICGVELVWVRYNGNPFIMNEDLASSEQSFCPYAYDKYGRVTYVRHEKVGRY